MIRVVRAVFVAAVLLVPVGSALSARAQSCTNLDPTCTVGDTADKVQQTAGDATDTANSTAGDAASTVHGTVDGILPHGGPPLPGGDGGSDPGNGGGHGGSGKHPRAHGHQQQGTRPTKAIAGGSPSAGSTTPNSGAPTTGAASDRNVRDTPFTISRVAAGVIGGVAVMGFLAGAIAIFLMVQDRLDRRDPKLLSTSLGSDRVQFT